MTLLESVLWGMDACGTESVGWLQTSAVATLMKLRCTLQWRWTEDSLFLLYSDCAICCWEVGGSEASMRWHLADFAARRTHWALQRREKCLRLWALRHESSYWAVHAQAVTADSNDCADTNLRGLSLVITLKSSNECGMDNDCYILWKGSLFPLHNLHAFVFDITKATWLQARVAPIGKYVLNNNFNLAANWVVQNQAIWT